jgi:peptidoglycan/LPS O-acetylase OafA/YrhL
MTNEAAVATRDRIPSLTGLRAWAALLVVLYHLSGELGALPVISAAVHFGRMGVTLFFVLSGFVLTYTYYGQDTPKWTFWWRRFVRIWPLHIAVLLGCTLGLLALGDKVSVSAVAPSALLLHAWIPSATVQGDVLGTSWSLSDEAFFYTLFPFLLLPVARRWMSWHRIVGGLWLLGVAYYLVISLSAVGFAQVWALDYLPLARVAQFVTGIAIGVAFMHGRKAPVSLWTALGLVVGWNLLMLAWDHAPSGFAFRPFSASEAMAFPLFALLIWAVADRDRDGRPSRVLASPTAIRLGHWSYAWYLVHRAGIMLWMRLAGRPVGLAATAVSWLVVAGCTLAVAGLCYELWEKPAERWLKYRFLGAAKAASATVARPRLALESAAQTPRATRRPPT